jgi:hypothetical protein
MYESWTIYVFRFFLSNLVFYVLTSKYPWCIYFINYLKFYVEFFFDTMPGFFLLLKKIEKSCW